MTETRITAILKNALLLLWGAVVAVLVSATLLERLYGTAAVHLSVYGAGWFCALWTVAAIVSALYILRRRLYARPPVFMLHLSFGVILVGALLTHLFGISGTMDVPVGGNSDTYLSDEGRTRRLPFELSIADFEVVCYPGTETPADYVSSVLIKSDGKDAASHVISMNNILKYRGYRFYQAGFNSDRSRISLQVTRDRAGITVTYIGYLMLLLSILAFFIADRKFAKMLRTAAGTVPVAVALLVSGPLAATTCNASAPAASTAANLSYVSVSADSAADDASPHICLQNTFTREDAERFCDICVYYQGRVAPLGTLAKEFTIKVYGKPSFSGMTAEQVLCGWLFFSEAWSREPFIKLPSGKVRAALQSEGKFASLDDLPDANGHSLLDSIMPARNLQPYSKERKDIAKVDEKTGLILSLLSGGLLKIIPVREGAGISWQSPSGIAFVPDSLDRIIADISAQQIGAGGEQPVCNRFRFNSEKLYNRYVNIRRVVFPMLTLGIILFLIQTIRMARRRRMAAPLRVAGVAAAAICWLYFAGVLALRWIIGAHAPLSNGPETMLLMAWIALLGVLVLCRRHPSVVPMGLLLAGLASLVATLGDANPRITPLVPVLSSPLMSIHVCVIMVSYVLFAFMMLGGVTAIIMHCSGQNDAVERLYAIDRVLLYPAVMLLAVGIFLGAVWANVSWGSYWSWDPKEVWALITMLVYSIGFHSESIPQMKRPVTFHIFTIVAFLSVLITYFGVNFFLGGMHSYAG
ncbi:MAG: cytochrome c biogenesis protein CcsA [Bacteroidales bacterium]|nr:cytochrome c biogenesis protein CcsA [Bacteroidales bacterium]